MTSWPSMHRIYIYEEIAHFRDSDFEKASAIVSESRKEKANGYLYAKDRHLSVIAELLLRYALFDTCSIREMPEIAYSQNGKPTLPGDNMPHFNISHCDSAVACAISNECIGIDVEPYSSYSEEVAKEVFNDKELNYVNNSPRLFAELWTKKESYLKYTGEGLTANLKPLLAKADSLFFDTLHSPHDYACTVCTREAICESPRIVDKEELFHRLSSFSNLRY